MGIGSSSSESSISRMDIPAAALITVAGFAKPEMMVEIQAIAVIGENREGAAGAKPYVCRLG